MLKLIRGAAAGRQGGALGCSAAAQLSAGWRCFGLCWGRWRDGAGGAFRLTPMPELLERAAAGASAGVRCLPLPDPAGRAGRAVHGGAGWREALGRCPWGWTAQGSWPWRSLGRCWAAMTGTGSGSPRPHPCGAVPGAGAGPGGQEKQGRMYQVLGITAGAFLVILLL